MADYLPLKGEDGEEEEEQQQHKPIPRTRSTTRLASLDVFRGLAVFLMIFVDYGGSVLPFIAHSPWNGVHLADFVMPFFLFISGVSLSLVYKNVSNKVQATCKAMMRAAELFLLGIFLQGGYLHGLNSLTFGVDIERIRWLGILQRISIGYIVAALCEIWLSRRQREVALFKSYYLHWCVAFAISTIYLGLLYGLYVPDWQFKLSESTSFVSFSNDGDVVNTVKCAVRGDLGPACNSAGMIDRYVLGADHLYQKPGYRNLKECRSSKNGQISDSSPSWCHAPFDPEGILSSLTAAITCIVGLHYGHVLVQLEDHKDRLLQWSLSSVSLFFIGLLLTFIGIPLNKPLYTISYMLLTSGTAGITFCALYLLVDVGGFKRLTSLLEWIGKHSLSIFVLVTSNLVIIAVQGFYWTSPENNIINWIVTHVVKR
ncbi:heparan-alpha-glucosaminide N-acetyltransferase-like [Telopea speciosissima]|uniref:heparan-alpha-glucosaminide N-acetyltransferase-like n=1 Tax=Telopea speciosissima TaxID=54955 RepID=UPI001CC37AA7|nr:heparan-alpha-glucosaminide N-acetyltransferase-like [Telopea speciosissima]